MPWFTYGQNNSFGRWVVNDTTAHTVFVEAANAQAANTRAYECWDWDQGGDCPCCGPRWWEREDEDGTPDIPPPSDILKDGFAVGAWAWTDTPPDGWADDISIARGQKKAVAYHADGRVRYGVPRWPHDPL